MNTNPFHISEAVTQEMLNDFQHLVERRIEMNSHREGFPTLEKFNLKQEELDDYLFEKQAILDSKGSERSRYTVAGILILVPVLILSMLYPVNEMPLGDWTLVVAVLAGLALWGLIMFLQQLRIKMRISSLDKEYPEAKKYVDAVLAS